MKPEVRVVLLGTGTPNAEPDRMGSSLAVIVDDKSYLVDFGPGVVRRANEAHQRYQISALAPENLQTAFLTHFHSDHTVGFPDLLLTPWVLGRTQPLKVYGPPGVEELGHHTLQAYQPDIQIRLQGLQPSNETGYQVQTTVIKEGLVLKDKDLEIVAFSAKHGSFDQAFGFCFQAGDKKIVVSGDTAPNPALVHWARGCDILIHEVYCAQGFGRLPQEWKDYHQSFHTSATELAQMSREIQPKKLVLTHQLYWGQPQEKLLEEVQANYRGEVIDGKDLTLISI